MPTEPKLYPYLMCLGLFPDDPVQLCTADRALALFWVGLQAHGFRPAGRSVSYDMTPNEALVPRQSGLD